ncbi:MAG: SH3 domain-containing protein [Cellvibrio sp.]
MQHVFKKIAQVCSCAILLWSVNASAIDLWDFDLFKKDEPLVVTVNDAYINVHNGAGAGYPIFHVIERGETITLLKMHTEWIKIETERGITGWINRRDMSLTLSPDGNKPDFPDTKKADYLVDRFEFSAGYGDFDGAKAFDLNLGYRFTKNLSSEIRFAQNTGTYSDSTLVALGINHQPFPDWYVSPYVGIAAGEIKTSPSTTLVKAEDRKDTVFQASLGAYVHITGRFFLRAELTNDYILTSHNTNEEVKEWKVGFSVFF